MTKCDDECGCKYIRGSTLPSSMSNTSYILATTVLKVQKKDFAPDKFTEDLSRTEIPFTVAKLKYQLYDLVTQHFRTSAYIK